MSLKAELGRHVRCQNINITTKQNTESDVNVNGLIVHTVPAFPESNIQYTVND